MGDIVYGSPQNYKVVASFKTNELKVYKKPLDLQSLETKVRKMNGANPEFKSFLQESLKTLGLNEAQVNQYSNTSAAWNSQAGMASAGIVMNSSGRGVAVNQDTKGKYFEIGYGHPNRVYKKVYLSEMLKQKEEKGETSNQNKEEKKMTTIGRGINEKVQEKKADKPKVESNSENQNQIRSKSDSKSQNQVKSNSGADSNSNANSKSGANAGSGSTSGAGSTAISDSSNGGVTVNNNFNKPTDTYSPSNPSIIVNEITTKPDGTRVERSVQMNGANGTFSGNFDDINFFSVNSEGSSVATGGNVGDGNAIGEGASVNGLSQKDKKLLTNLLNRNKASTDTAKTEILSALNKAKTTIQKGVKGAKDSADQASGASEQAVEQSKATQETVNQALAEFKKLSQENREIVQDAIDGFVKEIKGLIEADKITDNEAIQELLKQRVKQLNELKESFKEIVPQIAKYIDSQTESISADLNKLLEGQKAAETKAAAQQTPSPAADPAKAQAAPDNKDAKPDAKKPAENQSSQVIAWSNYALVA